MKYIIYKKVKYGNNKEYKLYYIVFARFTTDIKAATRFRTEEDAAQRYIYETYYELAKVEDRKDIDDNNILYIAKIDDNSNIISETKYYKFKL